MSLPKHSRKCLNASVGSPCICGLIERELRRFDPPLPAPPRGMVYGVDTDYLEWGAMRPGSNFEVPSFRPFVMRTQYPLATGISKKLYERSVAQAFLAARPRSKWRKVGKQGVAIYHFARLQRRGL